jgi:ACT domain-containing protein
MGPDAVGLVGRITAPIAQSRGNILDLRQDVLHGLFTIYMVVDLSGGNLEFEAFEAIIQEIRDDTGLQITVDRYTPVPRSPDKKNLLIICVGIDKPGIIAATSKLLGQYNANIEFSRSIGREGVFLMELLTDVSHVVIPVENLKRAVSENLAQLQIRTGFQEEQVFIKRKRLILFHIVSSFIPAAALDEILRQTGITRQELAALYAGGDLLAALRKAASLLEGLPLDVMDRVLSGVKPTAGSTELVQTLKVMGYKIVLASTACNFLTAYLQKLLDLDRVYGTHLQADDDSRIISGELIAEQLGGHAFEAVLAHVTAAEKVQPDDVATITSRDCAESRGIRLEFNLEVLLDCINQRVLSRDNLLGLLGSFGIPYAG